MAQDAWLCIGKIGKPYGLRGAFFISGHTPPFPRQCKSVGIGASIKDVRFLEVERVQSIGDREALTLAGIQDRTGVEKLVHLGIWVARSDLQHGLRPDEYLWEDVKGRTVLDPAGTIVGKVRGIENFGASDVVELIDDAGGVVSLPFVATYFDMNFGADGEPLRLVVDPQVFQELWQKDRK